MVKVAVLAVSWQRLAGHKQSLRDCVCAANVLCLPNAYAHAAMIKVAFHSNAQAKLA